MKKQNDAKKLEGYLEAHASELVETDDDLEEFIGSAKKDNDERRERATYLQRLRRDKLKLSQSELAKAVGANVRTLQGWETGRQDYPKAVEILMTLMRRMPQIKRILMRAKPQKKTAGWHCPAPEKKVLKSKSSRSQSTKKAA